MCRQSQSCGSESINTLLAQLTKSRHMVHVPIKASYIYTEISYAEYSGLFVRAFQEFQLTLGREADTTLKRRQERLKRIFFLKEKRILSENPK